jgi:hypothetical protein
VVLAAQLARLELPALAGVIALAVLVLAVICWCWLVTRGVSGCPRCWGPGAAYPAPAARVTDPVPAPAPAALAAGPVTGRLTLTAGSY